jgi:2-succinyl-5-enolpyruvyl-6-hydroxy-3-cyclohexene-1-carboxylate synthase
MYSNKKNVLQLAALLREYGIDHVVVSPGSRIAPLTQTFSQHPAFKCFTVVDERSAAFFALGLIQKINSPVPP